MPQTNQFPVFVTPSSFWLYQSPSQRSKVGSRKAMVFYNFTFSIRALIGVFRLCFNQLTRATLVTGLCFLFVGLPATADDESDIKVIKKFALGDSVFGPKNGYTFTVEGLSWQQVAVGAFSDGTSELELANDDYTEVVMVFDWGTSYTLNEATDSRLELIHESHDNMSCKESRSLTKDEQAIAYFLECAPTNKRTNKDSQYVFFSRMLEVDGRVIELYGVAIDQQEEALAIVRSLEPYEN